jgi:hypothetical protein
MLQDHLQLMDCRSENLFQAVSLVKPEITSRLYETSRLEIVFPVWVPP